MMDKMVLNLSLLIFQDTLNIVQRHRQDLSRRGVQTKGTHQICHVDLYAMYFDTKQTSNKWTFQQWLLQPRTKIILWHFCHWNVVGSLFIKVNEKRI